MSPVRMLGEERVESTEDGSIAFVVRSFAVVCEVHGASGKHVQEVGHHGSLQQSELRKLFSRSEYKRLKSILGAEAWRLFSDSLHGLRRPSQEERSSWRGTLEE